MRGLSLVVTGGATFWLGAHRLLTALASLVAEHRFLGAGFSTVGSVVVAQGP